MQQHRRRHTRAAIGDELPLRQLGQWLVPRSVQRTGNAARVPVDRIRLTTPTLREPCVDDNELLATSRELVGLDDVVVALAQRQRCGLDLLLTAGQRSAPAGEVEHRARVVPEMAKQPPEPFGAAHISVRNDEDSLAYARPSCGRREPVGIGQRVPPTRTRW